MDEKNLAFEVIAVVSGVIGGVWALSKAALNMRDSLDKRLDKLEREAVTRAEFNDSIKQLREEMRTDMQRIDNKLESMNNNIILLVHSIGETNK